MKLSVILIAGAAMAFAGSAMAQGACVRPAAPAAMDGTTATLEQLLANKTDVATFIGASDTFQTCVLGDLAAKKAAAKKAKANLDPAVVKAAEDEVSANQADKERVGTAFNAAAKAYKAAHPS
jgi:hypothetical protein